ncbi:MAG: hypothetical protein ACXWAT_09665 [Methylobacter sp.]
MPTNNAQNTDTRSPISDPLSLKELGEVLIKHYGIHEGIYDLVLEFQIGVGQVGPTPEVQFPGAMVSVSRIGLTQATTIGQTTVDASIVNPLKIKRKKSSG